MNLKPFFFITGLSVLAISALLSGCGEGGGTSSGSPSQLDGSFGNNGVVKRSFGADRPAFVSGLAVDQRNDIYVTANIRDDMGNVDRVVLLKYHGGGSPDTVYGDHGLAEFPNGERNVTTGVTTLSNGGNDESVVIGSVRVPDRTDPHNNWLYLPKIWKFNVLGKPDGTFNKNGIYYDPGTLFGTPEQVMTDHDLNIYVLGISYPNLLGSKPQINGIMKLRLDGSTDKTFGNVPGMPGVLGFSGDTGVYTARMVLDHHGNIIVAGAKEENDGYHVVLMRYTADGTLDTSFGVGGLADDARAYTPCAQDAEAITAVRVTKDDRIGVTGSRCDNGVMSMFLRYYDTDGSIVETFNRQAGEIVLDSDDTHRIVWRDMVIGEGGDFYVLGDVFSYGGGSHGRHMQVRKYNYAGDVVHSFGTDGVYDDTLNDCYGRKMTMDVNRYHLVVAGECGNDITLWKLNR